MICFLLVAVPVALAAASPAAGGAGYAAFFNQFQRDICRFDLPESTADQGVSIEWWQLANPLAGDNMVSASVYDSSINPPFDNPYYMTLRSTSLWVNGGNNFYDEDEIYAGRENDNQWHHYAYCFDYRPSYDVLIRYIDGEYAGNVSLNGFRFEANIRVYIGQELSSNYPQIFSPAYALDGAIDEFRWWNVTRTPEQIKANFLSPVVNPQSESTLVLYLNFDEPDGNFKDHSAKAVNIILGQVDVFTNYFDVSPAIRPSGAPSSPKRIVSRAKITSGVHYVRMSSATASFTFPSIAEDPSKWFCNITALPSSSQGVLTTMSNVAISVGTTLTNCSESLQFIAGGTPGLGYLQEHARISYTICNATGCSTPADVVFCWDLLPTPPNVYHFAKEGELSKMWSMSNIDGEGRPFGIEIVTAPINGTLFDEMDRLADKLTEITAVPYTATGPRGVFQYVSNAGIKFSESDSFTYRWVVDGLQSATATVWITVNPKNDGPQALSLTPALDATSKAGTTIVLQSVDVDVNFATRAYYRISKFPRFGTLLDGVTGEPVPQNPQPTAFGFVKEVVDGSDQYTECPDTAICSIVKEGLCAEQTGCNVLQWHAEQVRGVPDTFPTYADVETAWTPAEMNDEPCWLVLEFTTPLFLSGLEVYETYACGAIVGIKSTMNYTGVDTSQWSTLWTGPGPEDLPNKARIFTPPVCPVAILSKYVLISLGRAAAIDAVKVLGTISLGRGRISGDSVHYLPRAGVHPEAIISVDSFEYIASDCEDEGPGDSVSIPFPKPTPGSNSTFYAQEFIQISVAPTGIFTEVDLNLYIAKVNSDTFAGSNSGQNLSAIVPTGFQEGSFSFKTSPDGKVYQSSFEANVPLPSSSVFVMMPVLQGPSTFQIWFSKGGVVYRCGLKLLPVCTNGLFQNVLAETPCKACDSYGVNEQVAFTPDVRRRFLVDCPEPPLDTNIVFLSVLGACAFLLATVIYLFRRFRGEVNKLLRKIVKSMFFTTVALLVELTDMVTDTLVAINAFTGTSPELAPYKWYYLTGTLVGVTLGAIGVIVRMRTSQIHVKIIKTKMTTAAVHPYAAPVDTRDAALLEVDKLLVALGYAQAEDKVEALKKMDQVKWKALGTALNKARPKDTLVRRKTSWIIRDELDTEIYSTEEEREAYANRQILSAQFVLLTAFAEDLPMIVLNFYVLANPYNGLPVSPLVFLSLGISLLMFGSRVNAGGRLKQVINEWLK